MHEIKNMMESSVMQVHRRRMLDGAQVCETKLLQGAEPMVTPFERNFFAKLDEQLNKVDDFYRKKEAEFVERSEMLDKQMEALQEMQTILDHANSEANGDRNSDSGDASMGPAFRCLPRPGLNSRLRSCLYKHVCFKSDSV